MPVTTTPTAATLTLHLASLQASLLTSSSLPEPTASALLAELLPLLLQGLGDPDQLGRPASVWALCQELYRGEAHVSLAALLRDDESWPARRRELAGKLLGPAQLRALAQRHGKASPELIAQLAGRLSLVLLATAGQYSSAKELDANELHHWLRAPKSTLSAPAGAPGTGSASALGSESVSEPTTAEFAVATAEMSAWRRQLGKWWSLAGLVLVVLSSGGYYLSQPAASATGLAAAQPAARSLAAGLVGSPPATLAAQPASSEPDARLAAATTHPVSSTPTGTDKKAKKSAERAKRMQPEPRRISTRTSAAKLAKPAKPAEPDNPGDEPLYKRLAQPDPANRQMLDLDQLTFEQGQTTLDAQGVKRLKQVAAVLRKFPRNHLIVFGNAEPAEPQPLVLALNRAQVVVNELLKQGAPAGVLQAQGRMRSVTTTTGEPTSGRRIALYISPPPPPAE